MWLLINLSAVSGVVYNFGCLCLPVCMYIRLSDDSFQKPWRRKFTFAHPMCLQIIIRVRFVYEGHWVKITEAKKVKNACSCIYLRWLAAFYRTRQMAPHMCTPVTICVLSQVVGLRLESSLVLTCFCFRPMDIQKRMDRQMALIRSQKLTTRCVVPSHGGRYDVDPQWSLASQVCVTLATRATWILSYRCSGAFVSCCRVLSLSLQLRALKCGCDLLLTVVIIENNRLYRVRHKKTTP